MVSIIFSIISLLFTGICLSVIKLIFRFDITNALLVSGCSLLFTRSLNWNFGIRSTVFFLIFLFGIVLQHRNKWGRWILGAFSTFTIVLFTYSWNINNSTYEKWIFVILAIIVGVILNSSYWLRKRSF